MPRVYSYVLAAVAGAALALFGDRQIAREVGTPIRTSSPREYDDATLAQKVMTVEIVARAPRIRGVAAVENLMHLPADSVPRS
jgi:hypothetical protein